jgi:hypothetical protein
MPGGQVGFMGCDLPITGLRLMGFPPCTCEVQALETWTLNLSRHIGREIGQVGRVEEDSIKIESEFSGHDEAIEVGTSSLTPDW